MCVCCMYTSNRKLFIVMHVAIISYNLIRSFVRHVQILMNVMTYRATLMQCALTLRETSLALVLQASQEME